MGLVIYYVTDYVESGSICQCHCILQQEIFPCSILPVQHPDTYLGNTFPCIHLLQYEQGKDEEEDRDEVSVQVRASKVALVLEGLEKNPTNITLLKEEFFIEEVCNYIDNSLNDVLNNWMACH